MASTMANIVALKDVHTQLKARMEKTVDDFRANLLSTRTGRASVHMLDQVKVDYYGTDTPVAQVAQVHHPGSATDPRPTMGHWAGGSDREGHSYQRPGLQPDA